MKLTVDTKQRCLTGILFLVEIYKILMGTCLTLFVPRMCGTETCSLLESLQQDATLHRVAQASNAVSLILFFVYYGIELQRENWCIQYLDIDDAKSAIHLDHEIEAYPIIKQRMHTLNVRYKRIALICIVSQLVNIGVSTADIAMAWAGFSSLTPLASYTLLICMKLFVSYGIAAASLKDERALSAFMRAPKTYNTIDEDHRHKELSIVPVQTAAIPYQNV